MLFFNVKRRKSVCNHSVMYQVIRPLFKSCGKGDWLGRLHLQTCTVFIWGTHVGSFVSSSLSGDFNSMIMSANFRANINCMPRSSQNTQLLYKVEPVSLQGIHPMSLCYKRYLDLANKRDESVCVCVWLVRCKDIHTVYFFRKKH